jgi:hypothetical protein
MESGLMVLEESSLLTAMTCAAMDPFASTLPRPEMVALSTSWECLYL